METVIVMMTYITREQVGDVTVSSKLWQTRNTGDKSSIWLIGDTITIFKITIFTIFIPFLLLLITVVIIIIASLGFSKKHLHIQRAHSFGKYLLQTAVFKVRKKFTK